MWQFLSGVQEKDKNAAEVSIRPIHFVEEKTDAL